jgi:hypothetical protein
LAPAGPPLLCKQEVAGSIPAGSIEPDLQRIPGHVLDGGRTAAEHEARPGDNRSATKAELDKPFWTSMKPVDFNT